VALRRRWRRWAAAEGRARTEGRRVRRSAAFSACPPPCYPCAPIGKVRHAKCAP